MRISDWSSDVCSSDLRGSRILAVGANVAIPAGANVIELGDATLVPGYIDAHTHIAYDHDDDWAQGFYEGMLRFPVEQYFHAGRNAKATLLAGVTSARRSEEQPSELPSLMRTSYDIF